MYCNGTDWIAFGALNPSAGGSGCTNPDRAEGAVVYNNSFHVLQYCDGDDWRAVGGTVVDSGGGCVAPASCPNVGDLCADGSLFAGFMIYNNSSCEPLYVTDNNQSTSSQWKTSSGVDDISPDDHVDGAVNAASRAGGIPDFPAFDLCESNTYHGKNDWYLPARGELSLLWLNRAAIDASAGGSFTTGDYWSSTERNTNGAWYQDFGSGNQNSFGKANNYNVRCVRRNGGSGGGGGGDTTPDAFNFEGENDVATSALIESDNVQITGMDNGTAVSIAGDGSPEYRICADATCSAVNHDWTSGAGSIDPDEYLQLRLTSNAAGGAMHSATVTVGTESDQWDVTTYSGGPTGCPSIGDVCADGSIYAGLSPDGNVAMYTTPADAGSYTWNNGTNNWYDHPAITNCSDGTPGTASGCRTGEQNTDSLVNAVYPPDSGQPYNAAVYCSGLNAHGHTDWYLPAQDELNVLYDNRVAVGGFNTSGSYWSSSERHHIGARLQQFSDSTQIGNNKSISLLVRCVRRQ